MHLETIKEMSKEKNYDVIIVGAGPAGLSAAIQVKQLAQKNDLDISVCVLEKASEIGAHILSGAVIETVALDRLLPDWKDMDSPIKTKVKKDMGPIEVDVKKQMIVDTKSDESSVKLDEKIKGKVKTQKDKLRSLRK